MLVAWFEEEQCQPLGFIPKKKTYFVFSPYSSSAIRAYPQRTSEQREAPPEAKNSALKAKHHCQGSIRKLKAQIQVQDLQEHLLKKSLHARGFGVNLRYLSCVLCQRPRPAPHIQILCSCRISTDSLPRSAICCFKSACFPFQCTMAGLESTTGFATIPQTVVSSSA